MKFSLAKNSPLVGGEMSSCWGSLAAESRPEAAGIPLKKLLQRSWGFYKGGKWVIRKTLAYHKNCMAVV